MKITDLCLRRPMIATVLSALLFIAGMISLMYLPVRLYPNVEVDAISIRAWYPGASAALMDGRVTSEILSAVSDVEGVDYISSASGAGTSEVIMQLTLGSDSQQALTSVMERVNAISRFPKDMDPPQITRQAPEQAPDMAFAFSSQTMRNASVTDFLSRVVKPRLESIQGVGGVEILGSEYAMRVWLQPKSMERFGVTAVDVAQTLKAENLQSNAGILRDRDEKIQLMPRTGLSSVAEFASLPIVTAAGVAPVRLGDVARVELDSKAPNVVSRFNGQPATVVFIRWQRDGNPLRVGQNVRKALDALRPGFPSDLHADVLVDGSEYIAGAVHEVFITILLTAAAVTLVIFLGSGALRTVLVPVIAIPLSLLGVCLVMYLLGFSLNVLTLLAMVLATGLVVDDAIVVLDSALQRIRMGETPYMAAFKGLRRVAGSLLTMTLTLAIAYLPLIFIGGIVGKLFIEFAVTLAGSVLLSGLLAVTLTPVMCAKILSDTHQHQPMVMRVEAVFARLRRSYQRGLIRVLRIGNISLWLWAGCLAGAVALFLSLPQELAPKEDQGNLMVLAAAPSAMNTAFLSRQAAKLEKIYASIPEIVNYNYVLGIPKENQLLSFARLADWNDRQRSAMALQIALQRQLAAVPALQSVVVLPSSLPGAGGLPFQFVLKHADRDYRQLDALSDTLLRRLRQSGMFLFVNKDLKYDAPQLGMTLDRDQLAQYGVSAADVGDTLSLAYANTRLQSFSYYGRSYDVVLGLESPPGATAQDPRDLQVRSKEGNTIRLGSLLNQQLRIVPESLNTFQREASVTLQGVLAPDVALSQAVAFVRQLLGELKPRGVSHDLAGETRHSVEEARRLMLAFSLALLGIYFLLSLQFNSYRDPLIVLLGSVPFAVLGALLAMAQGGISLNLYTQLGVLTLVGLISKQGILMVQAANALREQGVCNVYFALVKASASRLRAILLTSVTMLLGALPLLFATGPASVSRSELGWVIVSGMVIGSLLTLFLLPSLYIFVHKGRQENAACV